MFGRTTTWKEYAAAIWRDSFVLWSQAERMTFFASVVLGSLLLGILVVAGVAVTFKPEAGLVVSGVLFVWLFILIFVVSPYRIWADQRQKLLKFEEDANPKIRVVSWRFNERNRAEFAIANLSTKTIDGIEVVFRNYRNSDGTNIVPVLKELSSVDGKNSPISLNPVVPTVFEFAELKWSGNKNGTIAILPGTGDERWLGQEAGVKLGISGRDIVAARMDFRLKVQNNNEIVIEPWKFDEPAVTKEDPDSE